jgi:hypothetical protein
MSEKTQDMFKMSEKTQDMFKNVRENLGHA